MDLDILISLGLVLIGCVMTGLGIEMANSPPQTNQTKWAYRLGFIGCTVVLLILTVLQSSRARADQNTAIEDRHKAELKSEADMGFVKGQLATIGGLITSPPSNLNQQQLIETIRKVTQVPVPQSTQWELSGSQKSRLVALLETPCKVTMEIRQSYKTKGNPAIIILQYDERDPEAFHFAGQLRDILQVAGCNVPDIERRDINAELPESPEPFFGVRVWDGYIPQAREAGRLMRQALMQVRPDTALIPHRDQEPQGGYYEGIAIVVGKRNF